MLLARAVRLPSVEILKPTPGAPGVDEPGGRAVLAHLLSQHGRVLHGVPHQESAAEARAEGRLRLRHAHLRARHLRARAECVGAASSATCTQGAHLASLDLASQDEQSLSRERPVDAVLCAHTAPLDLQKSQSATPRAACPVCADTRRWREECRTSGVEHERMWRGRRARRAARALAV